MDKQQDKQETNKDKQIDRKKTKQTIRQTDKQTDNNKTNKYRVFQKFIPIVNCILRKAFNASLGKNKLIQVRNLSK